MDPRPLICVWPRATRAVSVTGTECALNCAHCGRRYLAGMADLRTVGLEPVEAGQEEGRSWRRIKSLLVSGGCDRRGVVPLAREAGRLRRLRRRFRLNAHPGLVEEAEAEALAGWADVASLDFVADADTLREVYGLEAGPERFVAALRALRARLPVVPHLCLGLRGGGLGPEGAALDRLVAEGVDALVVLVFIPTPGTRYAGRSAPPVEEVAAFLSAARKRLPGARLTLGCMRPGGRYREALDVAAVEAGVDAIVQPAPAARRLAAAQGRALVPYDECCAFLSASGNP
ncbi:MAG: radical SAM protein [Bacillota bacterium]|nr:radical SAM protein [Bacillota bacterium]